MKVKMLEYYQDAQVIFEPGQVVDVGIELGSYLLKHRKAEVAEVVEARHLDVEPQFEQAEEPPHYGAQAEPEPRQDEKKYKRGRK